MTIQEIIQEARTLSVEERKQLIKVLTAMDILGESQTETPKKRSILEFEGIAAHMADAEDPQDYLKRLRNE